MTEDIEKLTQSLAKKAHSASRELAILDTGKKNAILGRIAELLEQSSDELVSQNEKDLRNGRENGLSEAMIDRLALTPKRIADMTEGVRQVIALPDPVGEEIERSTRPNGLEIRKIRAPMGVIGIIYESRPNVTIDCAVLCLKSGNVSILRGGKEAFHSNLALSEIIRQALVENDVNPDSSALIPTTDREALEHLLRLDQYVHCIIPRGGEGLIRFVAENSRIPVIKHYKGVCNLYVDSEADLELARKIAINAKCQRPGVCNAVENLFVHQDVADTFLPAAAESLVKEGVELRVDSRTRTILEDSSGSNGLKDATEDDYHEEFHDLVLAVKVVGSLRDAIEQVNRYGSGHSDAIVTKSEEHANQFMEAVDSSSVYWNASTRFTDGFEFGLGAEIGISTDRLHARGPMGLRELCTYKYHILGTGQVRE
ncbi:MAG: glutamate-5-semialdehyde dehydrogenase [Opitutae bacterium]|nr:glutamate-5-semialdehyde dehydrogenase [Opitutae bacterium]